MYNFDAQSLESWTNKGAFLTSGITPNVMTISWGATGVLWGRKIVIVPIRKSRYTHDFIEKTGEFTISIPHNSLSQELNYCGSKSGRDTNKIDDLHLLISKAKKVNTYYISGCKVYYECKVLIKLPLDKNLLPEDIQSFYKTDDMHDLYIAEILN
jgi:flavin reductase (DIM6/NTAB) family NADH-FMN oxidoreductase RutF